MKKLILTFYILLFSVIAFTQENVEGTQKNIFLTRITDYGSGKTVGLQIKNSNSNGYSHVILIEGTDTAFMQLDSTGNFVISDFISGKIIGDTLIIGGDTISGSFWQRNGNFLSPLNPNDSIGIGTISPMELLHITKNQNSATRFIVENQNTGVASSSQFALVNSSSPSNNALRGTLTGLNFSSIGAFKQNGGVIASESSVTGGLSLVARNSLADIRFYAGGILDENEYLTIKNTSFIGFNQSAPIDLLHGNYNNSSIITGNGKGLFLTNEDNTTGNSVEIKKGMDGTDSSKSVIYSTIFKDRTGGSEYIGELISTYNAGRITSVSIDPDSIGLYANNVKKFMLGIDTTYFYDNVKFPNNNTKIFYGASNNITQTFTGSYYILGSDITATNGTSFWINATTFLLDYTKSGVSSANLQISEAEVQLFSGNASQTNTVKVKPNYTEFPKSIIVKGDSTIITDVSGADSALIFDDGDTTRFESDNPIKVGNGSIIVETNGDVNISGTTTSEYNLGQLYTDDGSVVINIAATETYYTVTGLTLDSSENTTLTDSSITVSKSGYYAILSVSPSFTHATNSTICHFSVFVEDVEMMQIEGERKIGVGGDFGWGGMGGLLWLNSNEEVKIKAKADKTGNLTINHMNFSLFRL